ncbi:MAG: helix-turn-helix domain-containing protein [Nocardioidaceae bacterium]
MRRQAGERSRCVVIFRRLLGEVLRSQRMRQGRTLRQVSADARVSLGYISEIERGQKEASSELLAALCSALDVPLSEILSEVSDAVALEEAALAMQLEDVAIDAPRTISAPTGESGRSGTGDVVASAA